MYISLQPLSGYITDNPITPSDKEFQQLAPLKKHTIEGIYKKYGENLHDYWPNSDRDVLTFCWRPFNPGFVHEYV